MIGGTGAADPGWSKGSRYRRFGSGGAGAAATLSNHADDTDCRTRSSSVQPSDLDIDLGLHHGSSRFNPRTGAPTVQVSNGGSGAAVSGLKLDASRILPKIGIEKDGIDKVTWMSCDDGMPDDILEAPSYSIPTPRFVD